MPRKSQVDAEVEDQAIWTPETLHCLMVLLDQFVTENNGKHPTIKEFRPMAPKLFAMCYRRYSGGQIKTKYHRQRLIYAKWKKLLNQTGFGWDCDTNTPVCDKDTWADYCKANPGVSSFKHVGLPDLDLCKNVFDKASVTGGLGYSSSQMPPDMDEEQDIEDRFLYPDGRPSEQDADEEAFQDYIGGAHSGDKRPGPSSGRGRGRKKRNTDAEGVSAAMMEVASALRARTDISLASQRMSCETVNNEDDYSLAACQKLIESMSIPTPTYLKAMKYLMDNKEWRGVFGRMSEEHRWGWVASLE